MPKKIIEKLRSSPSPEVLLKIKETKEKAKKMHQENKIGLFGASANFFLYTERSSKDVLKGVYYCKTCGYEEINVNITDWEAISKKPKGLQCPNCKGQIWKPSGLLKKKGPKPK